MEGRWGIQRDIQGWSNDLSFLRDMDIMGNKGMAATAATAAQGVLKSSHHVHMQYTIRHDLLALRLCRSGMPAAT
jgi:hypothetical protein